jgi:hypothetical protein
LGRLFYLADREGDSPKLLIGFDNRLNFS